MAARGAAQAGDGRGRARVSVPPHWPAALAPRRLAAIETPTPYLVTDLSTAADRFGRLTAALPGVQPYYAMTAGSVAGGLVAVAVSIVAVTAAAAGLRCSYGAG